MTKLDLIPESEIRRIMAERDEARRALSIYGGHISPCPGRPCECGFQQAWDCAKLPPHFGSVIDASVEKALFKTALRFIAEDAIPQGMPAAMFAERVLAGSEHTSACESK